MEKEEINKKIIESIKKARELGWIQNINGEPHIHLADVEKIIYGIFDESYIDNLLKSKEDDKGLNETQGGTE